MLKRAKLQEILGNSLIQTIFSAKAQSLSAAMFAVHIFDGACKHIPVCGGKIGKS